MEDLIVDVKLWGQVVGSLVWDQTVGMAVFEYDDAFRRRGIDPAPLTMPLSLGNRPFGGRHFYEKRSIPRAYVSGGQDRP